MEKEKRKLTKAEWFFGITEMVGGIGGYKIGRSIANQAGVNNVYSVLFGIAVGRMTTKFLDETFKVLLNRGEFLAMHLKML